MMSRRTAVRMTMRSALVTGLAFTLVGCDLTVTNPGPVEDPFLDDPAAHPAIVYGAMRAFSDALGTSGGSFAMCGAVIAREWFPSGQTSSFACSLQHFWNELTPDNAGAVDRAQLATWLAETGVERIKASRGDQFQDFELAALGLL